VGARQRRDLDLDRPDLVGGSAVRPDLPHGNALADDLLLELVEDELNGRGVGGRLESLVLRRVALEDALLDRLGRVLPRELVLDRGGRVDLLAHLGLDLVVELDVGLRRLDGGLLPAGLVAQLGLQGAELLDLAVGDIESVEDLRLGDLVGAGFDHEDGIVRAGNDQVEVGQALGQVGLGRVDHEVAVDLADADRAHRRGHRDLGDHQRRGGAVHRQHVVGV
jgi:hypothetical protein